MDLSRISSTNSREPTSSGYNTMVQSNKDSWEYFVPKVSDQNELESEEGDDVEESKKQQRLISIDVFRGAIISLMIFVNNAGGSSGFAWIDHAEWDYSFHLADYVMPFFLFIVGFSTHLSLQRRRLLTIDFRVSRNAVQIANRNLPVVIPKFNLCGHVEFASAIYRIVARFLKLMVVGLILQGALFPNYNLETIRVCGILQRIAICYTVVAFFYLFFPRIKLPGKGWVNRFNPYIDLFAPLVASVLGLVVYFSATCFVKLPGCGWCQYTTACNVCGYLDTIILTPKHMYGHPTCAPDCAHFDPEGLISTLGAIPITGLGLTAGILFTTAKLPEIIVTSVISSAVAIAISLVMNFTLFPVNKNLFSVSYSLMNAGLAQLVYLVLYVVIDLIIERYKSIHPSARLATLPYAPFEWMGKNSIVIFFFDGFLVEMSSWIYYGTKEQNARELVMRHLFAWKPIEVSSLVYALCDVAFWMFVAGILHLQGKYYRL